MIYSFTAVPNKFKNKLLSIQNKIKQKTVIIEDYNWMFLFKSSSLDFDDSFYYNDGKETYYVIGEIHNIEELRISSIGYCSDSFVCNPAKLIYTLHKSLGDKALSLVDGAFTLIICSSSNGLMILTDPLGLNPVNIILRETMWISSELKMIGLVEKNIFDFVEPQEVTKNFLKSDNYLPIKNALRLKPGQIASIKEDGNNYPYLLTTSYYSLALGETINQNKVDAIEAIICLLKRAVHNCIKEEEKVAAALSGGLDSSFIAGLATKENSNVRTYSIGTKDYNEFKPAKLVSTYLKTTHSEVLLSEEDMITGILEAVYHNEIFDGLSAEIQCGLFNLYKKHTDSCDVLVTGYGSDLLFGGILNPDCDLGKVNKILWDQVYRTRWTGEFSYFGSLHYGLKVRHPFWNLKLINFCLSLEPTLKISGGDTKILLKEAALQLNLMPQEIISRKKIGIHEGSALNKLFAKLLGTETADYKLKTEFTYDLYKKSITGELNPDQRDTHKIIKTFSNK